MVHKESQWSRIVGYFVSIMGYFRVEWPVILGYLAFQADGVVSRFDGHMC